MHNFVRLLQRSRLCALVFLQGFACGVLAGRNQTVEALGIVQDASFKRNVFSPPWFHQYTKAASGCTLGRGSYTWRDCGFGSNINNMLNTWVYVLAVEEWSDLSIISDGNQFQGLNCSDASGGLASHGLSCIFSSMPHMCIFSTTEVLSKYLWSNMTPWLRTDVNFVIHAEKVVEGSPFLGMHVRRGDKIAVEAAAVEVKEYLKAAVTYFEAETTPTKVDDIKAIWVASDDPNIVNEVRTLAPAYFPGVPREAIVYVANGVTGGSITRGVDTMTKTQDYGALVYLLADLAQLASAELFVGTFSSNVARLVVLLRKNLGKSNKSSISVDDPSWYAGRQRRSLGN